MLSFESFDKMLSKEFSKYINLYHNDKYIGVNVDKEKLYLLIKYLKEYDKLKFNQLIDITAIDFPSREFRFDIVYILLSLSLNERVVVKTSLNENDVLESVTSLYKSANWYERECYDLFGIKFINHPDLRRIMTDYNFEGHPLRKDFPLTGHIEVRYSEEKKKVISEPVKLDQEYRDFDFESPWEGTKYIKQEEEKNKNKDK